MKAAYYYGNGVLRLKDVEIPSINEEEVLVRVKACSICGTDLVEWYQQAKIPCVLGHEISGTIEKVGSKVKKFKEGDRVFVHHHIGCFNCIQCRKGNFTMCSKFKQIKIYPGGFSEFIKVSREVVKGDMLLLPENIDYKSACLIEPFATCLRSIKKCGIRVGDRVALIGDGSSSIMHVILLKMLGACKIIVLGHRDFRLQKAKENGADIVINTNKENPLGRIDEKVDHVIITVESLKAFDLSFKMLEKGGTLELFAPFNPKSELILHPALIFNSEIRVIASYSASHIETREILSLIENKRIFPKKIITHVFKLDDIEEAFKTARNKDVSLKVVVKN
jgi:L-iditol 2-dehydrogenase